MNKTHNPIFNITWALVRWARRSLQEYALEQKYGSQYSFGASAGIEIGKPSLIELGDWPGIPIKAERITINCPCVSFLELTDLRLGNESMLLGGTEDAYAYSPENNIVGGRDMPIIQPFHRVRASMNYTGLCPAPLEKGNKFLVCLRITGRAALRDDE